MGDRPSLAGARLPRRAMLAAPLALLPLQSMTASAETLPVIEISLNPLDPESAFVPERLSTVGIYDADWLLTPPFERMLDMMASSPGAISGVRFFGIFSSGTTELLKPDSGGTVWLDPQEHPDFTLPFAALEALTSRGLTPFIALGFFPPAVSESPIVPPASFDRWQELVTAFLRELAADARFGADAITSWRFEIWNEPNEGRFWQGSFGQYLALYQATAEAVRASGLSIRLGGPAMAYKPESEAEDGPETLKTFLEFLRDHPEIQCDFISYHRKGTVDRSPPDPGRLWNASDEVEQLIREIVPERTPALEVINNEADEKIGFEAPYAPRMDAFAASWLTTLVSINVLRATSSRDRDAIDHCFYPDNANLQLMQEPYDGRRSIYIPGSTDDRTRLIKSPGAIWYDLLPLLEGIMLQVEADGEQRFPDGELHVVATRTESSCSVLMTWFVADEVAADASRSHHLVLNDLPWEQVNVIEYRIDSTHSNSYTAAGGSASTPVPSLVESGLDELRLAQELTFLDRSGDPIKVRGGTLRIEVDVELYATVCFWITRYDPQPIAAPANLRIQHHGDELDIFWDPVDVPHLLGYEVERIGGDGQHTSLTRKPVRPVMVTDTPHPGAWEYRVRSVSSSNVVSSWTSTHLSG